jgi:hypothetical protein
MKTNFTLLKYVAALLLATALTVYAHADGGVPTLGFTKVPTLVSGNGYQTGAVYKFENVANGTHALVTIVSATGGATVDMLDDNNLTKPEAFSPRITVPAHSSGMVTFRVDFINGGGNPKNMTQFSATAMDIDGTNLLIHEMDAINMGAGSTVSYLSSLLEINVQPNGTGFLGVNVGGNEYPAVDTSAKQVMFTVTSPIQLTSFTYSAGVNNLHTDAVTRQKGIYFKGFDYLSFLPVKYSSFTALTNANGVNLNWATQSEINNKHFEIERSLDGINFKTVGINANGITTGYCCKAYMYLDNSVASDAAVVYYRLKQVDYDGRSEYSNILVVRLSALSGAKMQIMPNPFVENVTVRFDANAKTTAQLQIIGTNGQIIMQLNATVNKGNNSLQITGLTKLAPGAYQAQLYANGLLIATQKIIKT